MEESVRIIDELLARKVAYRYGDNIYFDPLRYPRFGALYGLDMSRWPKKKRRFHKDTYPGMRWNLGDFILWHGCSDKGEVCWESSIGLGRPSWNIQDASAVKKHVGETLSVYCGGIDNLIRHHDYTMAILESVKPYRMARYWMHCHHLHVDGKKMSKSLGNIYYADSLLDEGYSAEEIRFFLIYGHYRQTLDYTDKAMRKRADLLRRFRDKIAALSEKGANAAALPSFSLSGEIARAFTRAMNDDLNVGGAFDGMAERLPEKTLSALAPEEAASVTASLRHIDSVLQVIL